MELGKLLKSLKKVEPMSRGIDLELWFDKHNHRMAAVRTITSALAILLSTIILYKVW